MENGTDEATWRASFHFSLQSLLVVTTVIAAYFGGYLAWFRPYYTPDEMLALSKHLTLTLPQFGFFCLAITWVFNRRKTLKGSQFALSGLIGIASWDYLLAPLEAWGVAILYATTDEFDWLHDVRTVYYGLIPCACWALVLYAYHISNIVAIDGPDSAPGPDPTEQRQP